MRKTRVLIFAAIILSWFCLENSAVFAIESEKVEESVIENIATFEADENDELKEMIKELQLELSEMKNGMSKLQNRMVESEMSQLRTQLINLQNDLLNESSTKKLEGFNKSVETIPNLDLDLVSETKSEFSSEESEAEIEFYEDGDLAAKLILAETEITKLKSELAEKEVKEKKKENDPLYKKIENEVTETSKEEVEKKKTTEDKSINIGEKMAKAIEEAEKIAEKEDKLEPANIIAKADGESLYRFPRSLSSKEATLKTIENAKSINAKNLVADILTENDESPSAPNFKRSSASTQKFNFFSFQNIAIMTIAIILVVGSFIYFLIKNERKLLLACQLKLQKTESRNDFSSKEQARKNTSYPNDDLSKKIIK